MNDAKPSAKRNYFRAPVSAKTRVRLVEESDRDSIKRCFDLTAIIEDAPGSEPSITQALAILVTMFDRIDDKLDRILGKLENDEWEKPELDVRDTLDISGSGISILLTRKVPENQLIHLSITFRGSHRGQVDVLGRVARCVAVDQDREILYQTGIEFLDLNESEKDLLVKYTFSQHRKRIRSSVRDDGQTP